MDYFPSSFSGFNKKTKYRESEFLKDKDGYKENYNFSDKIYNLVAEDIYSVLGKKEVYIGQEAYYYFHKRYFAFPIDYRNYYNYQCLENIDFGAFDDYTLDDDGFIEKFSGEVGQFYSYIKNGKLSSEKTITMVIDTSNELLRQRFPQIQRYFDNLERNLITVYGSFERFHEGIRGYFVKDVDGLVKRVGGTNKNVIIVIGSLNGKSINSMNILCNDGFITELGYAVEFFYRHS